MHGSTITAQRKANSRAQSMTGGLHQLIGRIRWLLTAGPKLERGSLHREVMRLEVVAGRGNTLDSYGWHVDTLLNVGVHYPNGPIVAPDQPDAQAGGLPAKIVEPAVSRAPRTPRARQLNLGAAHT